MIQEPTFWSTAYWWIAFIGKVIAVCSLSSISLSLKELVELAKKKR